MVRDPAQPLQATGGGVPEGPRSEHKRRIYYALRGSVFKLPAALLPGVAVEMWGGDGQALCSHDKAEDQRSEGAVESACGLDCAHGLDLWP